MSTTVADAGLRTGGPAIFDTGTKTDRHRRHRPVRAAFPMLEPDALRKVIEKRRIRLRDRLIKVAGLLFAGDLVVAVLAVYLGFAVRNWQYGRLEAFNQHLLYDFWPLGAWVIGGGATFTMLLALFRSYEPGRIYRVQASARSAHKALLLWPVLMLAVYGLVGEMSLAPRLAVFYSAIALALGLAFWRAVSFGVLMHPRVRKATRSRVLVVGWNATADRLRNAMVSDLGQLKEVVGCVPTAGGYFRTKPPADVPILGDYSEIPSIVGPALVDSVIVADPSMRAGEIRTLIQFCQDEYLDFSLVPDYFPTLHSRLGVNSVSGVALLGIGKLPLDSLFSRVVKRATDIVGGVVGLVLSAPVIAIFGAWVKIESPGPVFYRQTRSTKGGKPFTIYKIRSMRADAEKQTGAVWARPDDPRRLRIGAFMRRWNIDELPQFWNVIKGDMSLVGPRPERPELIESFKYDIPNYNVRHQTRAGLTGWAAVHGYRGDTDLRKRIEFDIFYVENWSLPLDLYCILATFFKRDNAY